MQQSCLLSQNNPAHNDYPNPFLLRSTLILSTLLHLGFPSDLLPSGFSHSNPISISLFPHSCHIPHQYHSPRPDCLSNIWLTAQITKLLITQLQTSNSTIKMLGVLHTSDSTKGALRSCITRSRHIIHRNHLLV